MAWVALSLPALPKKMERLLKMAGAGHEQMGGGLLSRGTCLDALHHSVFPGAQISGPICGMLSPCL